MIQPAVVAPITQEWNEAFLRVESYLRAHHLESRVLLNALARQILADAQALGARRPGEHPVVLAMEAANAAIGAWYTRVLGEGDASDERFLSRGRMALLLSDLPRRAPEYFLSPRDPPAELMESMRGGRLQSGPEIRFTHMPPTLFDEIVGDSADPVRARLSRRAVARVIGFWIGLAVVLGFAWGWTH